MRGLKFKIG